MSFTAKGVGEQLQLELFDDNASAIEGYTFYLPPREPLCEVFGGLSSSRYWSSTENNNNNAWNLAMGSGSWNNNNKNNVYAVRCARSQKSHHLLKPSSTVFSNFKEISLEEVFEAYFECRKRKRNKREQLNFEVHLERNLIDLYDDIKHKTYELSPHKVFAVTHPKPREVWAADFRDRVVHHLIYRRISPFYHNKWFSINSFACIPERGIHNAVNRVERYARQVTKNYQLDGWYLKIDVKNFFNSIDVRVLAELLFPVIESHDEMSFLVNKILSEDFKSNAVITGRKSELSKVPYEKSLLKAAWGKGLPIGNLTSQFFANLYLDQVDKYIERELKINKFARYVDDIVMFDVDLNKLREAASKIDVFIRENLLLSLHPDKTKFGKIKQGFDFVGYFCLPGRRYVRKRTLSRIKSKYHQPNEKNVEILKRSLPSYSGVLKFANHHKLRGRLFNLTDFD